MVLDFVAVDNFDFTRKIVKKIWGEKQQLGFGGMFLGPGVKMSLGL